MIVPASDALLPVDPNEKLQTHGRTTYQMATAVCMMIQHPSIASIQYS